MACNNLGTFTTGSASPTGLCSGPFTLTIYGDNLNIFDSILNPNYLYTDAGCTTLLTDNLYYSDGSNIYYYKSGTQSITTCAGCDINYCIFDSGYSYDGEYGVSSTYNGFDYYTGATNGYYIYYSLTEDSWCLSTSLGGYCDQFGPSGVGSICPDLYGGFFYDGVCPTTTTTTTSACELFDFDVIFDCLISATPTPTPTPTPSSTPTPTPSTSNPCGGFFIDAKITGYTPTPTPTNTPTPTPSPEITRPCNFDGLVNFNIFDEYMRCGNTKKFKDCLTGIDYYTSDVILDPSGNTPTQGIVYKSTVNGYSMCLTFIGLVDNISGIDTISLDSIIGLEKDGSCLVCVPDPTPTPIPCDCYSLYGGSTPSGTTFNYIDCDMVDQEITVGRSLTGYTCSSTSITITSGNGYVLGLIGECENNVCPTTTTTTTTAPCDMIEYLILNQGPTTQSYQYKICGFKAPITDSLVAYHSIVICSSILPTSNSALMQITPTGNVCS